MSTRVNLNFLSFNPYFLHTLPIEPMLKTCVISNDNVTVLKACGKRALADVNCYCKMTSVVMLDEVTSFHA